MKKPRSLRGVLALAGLAIVALAPGCTTAGTPGIPGVGKAQGPVKDRPIPTSVVLLALKAQFAQAIKTINDIKGQDPRYKGVFEIKKGTGVFTGSTQVVNTAGTAISAIIPFTGYADSKLKPKIGASGTATNVQATILTFDLNPAMENYDILKAKELAGIQIGSFVTDALVACFNEAAALVRSGSGKGYDPRIKFSEIDVTAAFTVVRKYEGGLGETIIMMPAPDLDSLGPTASGSRERTGVYKIELKFPLNVDAPADTRRIVVQQPLGKGRTLSVEEAYSEDRYRELRSVDDKKSGGDPQINPADTAELKPGEPLGPVPEPRGL